MEPRLPSVAFETSYIRATKQWVYLCRLRLALYPLPAGIYWERTGGKTHRLTIVRAQ